MHAPLSVVVVGIEHKKAPLELLERATVVDADLAKTLGTLRSWENVQEAVVLSTCLRTEVYAVVDRFHDAVDDVCELLATHAGLRVDDVQEHTAVRFDDEVAAHLFTVAAGLESAVLGETEVLGQVRRAWERAHEERASGPVLGELFRNAVQAGKRVRAETGIARGTTSFSFAAIELAARRRPGGLAGADVTVVGAGEMGSGIVQALGRLPQGRRPASVAVVNRSVERARQVAASAVPELGARAAGMGALEDAVAASDVVFTAVEVEGHVLSAAAVAAAATRPGGLLVVDLGMPRNVDPSAAAIGQVTLLDMDDLRSAVTQAVDERRGEAERAAEIVAEELVRYRAQSRERGAAPVVSALRARLEELRATELERHRSQLGALGDGAFEEADAVTRAVLAKILHEPTVALRETSGTSKGERLVEALRALFDL
ncbi:MAG TPA: glutamyl-tRNA reductase [Acidimicrobiales bacterium]|nr:glutamyl-tRNA reductase [Acidimicrobiales bacterium]